MHHRKHRHHNDHDDDNEWNVSLDKTVEDAATELHVGVHDEPPHVALDGALAASIDDHLDESSSSSSSRSSSSSSCSSEPVARSTVLRSKPLRQDTKWSLASNSAFLLGSVLQAFPATWDLLELYSEGGGAEDGAVDDDDGADDNDDGVRSDRDSARENLYFFLTAGGAFVYVVNALVDLAWATSSGRSKSCGRPGGNRSWYAIMFDRDVHWEVWSAIAFGVGAARELAGAIVYSPRSGGIDGDDDDDDDAATPEESRAAVRNNVLSMSTYLISGVLSLKARDAATCTLRWRSCSCSSKRRVAEVLVKVGGVLFIVGSLADLVLALLDDRTMVDVPELTLAWGNFVCALMWLVDALLLLISECIRHSLCGRMKLGGRYRRRVAASMLPVAMHVPLLASGNKSGQEDKLHV